MVYQIHFESDVQGIASTKRVNGEMYVYAKDGAAARHYAEGYIESAYSDVYAIIECVPLCVFGLGE